MSNTDSFPSLADSATMILRVYGARPFHADGDLVALTFDSEGSLCSIEEPGVVRTWDMNLGKPTDWHALEDLPVALWGFGPGGKLAVSATNEISLWDASKGICLATWPAMSWITALNVSASGNYLATGHDDTLVRLWDITRSKMVRVWSAHDLPVSAVAFSPNGECLATAGEDRIIHLWNVQSGELIGSLVGHTDRIPALAWHPDGTRLVSAGWDTTARVWDVATREPVMLLNGHTGQVYCLAFNPDGRLLATADSANVVHVWDFASSKIIAALPEQTGEIKCLAFSPDGGHLVAGGEDRVIQTWDAGRSNAATAEADPMASRTCLAVSPDGTTLASVGTGTSLRVWDTETGEAAIAPKEMSAVRTMAASSDGRWYAASQDVGDNSDIWNAKVLPSRPGPRSTLGLWDARSGAKVATFEGQLAPITALAFSPDSQLLASAGFLSSDVWLWQVPSGEPSLLLPGVAENCSVEALAFQPRGNLLAIAGVDWMATGADDGQVFLWDLAAKKAVRSFPGGAVALSFHPNGQRLAIVSQDHFVRVFDVNTGDVLSELVGHLDRVTCVAYSPGGRWIATGGDDHTVRLWDADAGVECGTVELDTQVKALTFSPEGRRLYTGNGNTSCYLLDVGQFLQR